MITKFTLKDLEKIKVRTDKLLALAFTRQAREIPPRTYSVHC